MRAVLLNEGAMRFVPNVPAYILNVGSEFNVPLGAGDSPHRLAGMLYGSYYGKKPLAEDGVLTTRPFPRISGRLGYTHERSGWGGHIDVIWYPGDRLSETAVNLGGALATDPSQIGVNPVAPLMVMVGASYAWR